MSTLYWIIVLGNLNTIAGAAFIIFAAFLFISSFVYFDKDCSKSNKRTFKICLIGILVSLTLCTLIPSKTELYAIYGIGSVIDSAKGSKEVQKLPDNAVRALNIWLENVNKDKKDSINNN